MSDYFPIACASFVCRILPTFKGRFHDRNEIPTNKEINSIRRVDMGVYVGVSAVGWVRLGHLGLIKLVDFVWFMVWEI